MDTFRHSFPEAGVLTQRQLQLLKYIDDYQHEHGVPPSFDEMRAALKLRSKSGIHRLISGLEERGYIRRLAYRARALEVLRPPPGGSAPAIGAEAGSNVVRGPFPRARPEPPLSRAPRRDPGAPHGPHPPRGSPAPPAGTRCRSTAASPPASRSRRWPTPRR